MNFNFFKKIWGKRDEKDKKESVKKEIAERNVEIKEAIEVKNIFPLITEKSMNFRKENKYVFAVYNKMNKNQIKKAIEKLFNVKVKKVWTINYSKRLRGVTRIKSKRPGFKKAIVQLEEGQKIPILE